MAPSLKDRLQGLPGPLLIMMTILGTAWQALALGPAAQVAWCPRPAAVTLHPLRPNLLPEPRHTGSYHQPPLSPSSGGSRQGRAGMGLGSWRAMEVVRDRGLQLEGVVTPVMLPVPLTTTLRPGVFRHQTSLQPRCRARRVPAPAQPTRRPATAGSASAQSWPVTLSLHVPMAPMRSAVVRATGGHLAPQ